jgi:hypothetical protein
VLAAACAEAGDFGAAVRWQLKANDLLEGPARAAGEERLARYRVGEPYRSRPATR